MNLVRIPSAVKPMSITKSSGQATSVRMEQISPATAIGLPASPVRLICVSAMAEKMMPSTLNGTPEQQQTSTTERRPITRPATAKGFVSVVAAGVEVVSGMMAVGGTAEANSAIVLSGTQSFAPSRFMSVWPLVRPSAIQRRTCSAGAGPY